MNLNTRRKNKMLKVTCYLPEDVIILLDANPERNGRSRSARMRRLLNFCLKPEDWFAAQENRDQ